MELDLETQINLFLITYRNNCLTKEGHFPAERIFSYNPKTLIDLINPKRHFKHQLLESQPHDDTNEPKLDGNVHKGSNDPFSKLTAGDDFWYKNHNPHVKTRWIKANFIKWHSRNILQVQTGSVPIMAHRNQIRICNTDDYQKPNLVVLLRRCDEAAGEGSIPQGEVIEDMVETPPIQVYGNRKRKCDETLDVQNSEPRRSKRIRKAKKDDSYVYS